MKQLQVPYLEKDLAKKLGAKWHSELKTWFIPSDMDPTPFAKWISVDCNSNLTQANSTAVNNGSLTNPYSLKFITNEIKNLICNKYFSTLWIIVEISELKPHNNNLFLGLVEYDEQGNLLARARGIIWNYIKIIKKFIDTTNIELKAGIKTLINVNIDYHLQYGLTLIINDIDPSYTLGEASAKLLKIKEQLIKENVFYNNKNLPIPFDFYKIAVISPNNAAGLGDFQQDALKLDKNHLCSFDYYTAIFQGSETKSSIISCINRIATNYQIKYDAIVIIRGGGATSDLTWLNDYDIAKTVCLTKIPILCGIGHNKDQTIIDQIATLTFDTPSKVIGFIINHIVNKANKVALDFEFINQYTDRLYQTLNNDLLNSFEYIKSYATQRIEYINKNLEQEFFSIPEFLQQKLITLTQLLDATMNLILSRSPEQILSMGFALVYIDKPDDPEKFLITSQKTAVQTKKMLLKFHDGTVKVKIDTETPCD